MLMLVLYYVMLCNAGLVLCCDMLGYGMLCYCVWCCAMLCYVMFIVMIG